MKESFQPEEYEKGTIEINSMPEGGRDLDLYAEELMFDPKELANKDVLDLGAGPKLKLDTGLKEAGINARIVSLSPDFADEEHRQKAQKASPDSEMVAGVGERLPFAAESFDYILANHVVQHLKSRESYFKLIEETARVIRKGGKAIIGPMYDRSGADPMEDLTGNSGLTKALRENKAAVSIEYIPTDIKPSMRIRQGDMYFKERVQAFNIVVNKKADT